MKFGWLVQVPAQRLFAEALPALPRLGFHIPLDILEAPQREEVVLLLLCYVHEARQVKMPIFLPNSLSHGHALFQRLVAGQLRRVIRHRLALRHILVLGHLLPELLL